MYYAVYFICDLLMSNTYAWLYHRERAWGGQMRIENRQALQGVQLISLGAKLKALQKGLAAAEVLPHYLSNPSLSQQHLPSCCEKHLALGIPTSYTFSCKYSFLGYLGTQLPHVLQIFT